MNASAEASHRTNVGRKDTISRCCDKGDYVGGRKTKNNSLPGVVHVCWGTKAPFRTSADDYRGRDASYLAPPAQIRAGPLRAYGAHLGCLTANRVSGPGGRIRG